MDAAEVARLAEDWIKHWSKIASLPKEQALKLDAAEGLTVVDHDLPRKKPEMCWQVIQEILNRIEPDPSNRLFQVLAAGPLEDLLANHGEAFMARIKTQAENDPRFARLLGGVWRNTMSSDVWAAVQGSRSESW